MTTQQYAKSMDRAYRKSFVDVYEQKKPRVEAVYKIEDLQDKNEKEFLVAGLGQMVTIQENTEYPDDQPLESYATTYTYQKKGKKTSVTLETETFAKNPIARGTELGTMHAKAVTRSIEKDGADQFNNGFDDNFTSFGDNVSRFAVDHQPANGGAVQSNASASGAVFSPANLDDAIVALAGQKDDRGELIDNMPDVLVLPRQLESYGLRTLKSSGRAGTANNDENPLKMREYYGSGMKIVVWDYLTSDTAWFIGSLDNNQSKRKVALKPRIAVSDESVEFNKDARVYKSTYMDSFGWTDFRGWWGSKGDGQTFS